MSSPSYRSGPEDIATMPSGIPFIVANEAAERFSYYGMRTILVVFMTKYLVDGAGNPDLMDAQAAKAWYHTFSSGVYLFPLLGALVSDLWLGKYRTIIALSVVYCLGHLTLAMDDTRTGLAVGLALIAIGSGGIKPCVSAHVGDQFAERNAHLLERVFGWFYFAINLGAFISTLLTPWLLEHYGPHLAFGVPGILMFAATLVFHAGRHRFAHVPADRTRVLAELRSADTRRAVARLAVLYMFVAVFWSLYDQTGGAWVLQAERMDRHLLGIEWLTSQIQAVNPILILLFIPTFSYGVYPLVERRMRVTALGKVSAGLFLAAASFLVSAWIESRIGAGATPSIAWQLLAYVVLTAAEILVSIPCLEFSYTQAPRTLKSLVMAAFLLSISAGNMFTAAVNALAGDSALLAGAGYYLFFAALMALTALLFVPVARRFPEQTVLQPPTP